MDYEHCQEYARPQRAVGKAQRYRWRFRTDEAFHAAMMEIAPGDLLEANRLYWRDQLGLCEAYAILSTWRTVDLARGCIWALARSDIVGAALMARSALENSAQLLDTSRSISATLVGDTVAAALTEEAEDVGKQKLLDPSVDFRKAMVISEDFEKLLSKTLFATRLPGSEEIFKPTNIVTIIDRIIKIDDGRSCSEDLWTFKRSRSSKFSW